MTTARKPTLRGRRLISAPLAARPRLLALARCEVGRSAARRCCGAGVRRRADDVVRLRRATPQRRSARGSRRAGLRVLVGWFVGLSLFLVLVSSLRIYLRQLLEIRWRRGLTGDYVARWIGGQAYGQSAAPRRRDRQSRPAHRRGRPRLRRERARPLALAARRRRHAGLVRRAALEPLERLADPHRRRAAPGARAAAVGGDRVLDRLDVAHPPARPPPGADQLRPLPLRGGLPLRAGALPRPRRGRWRSRAARPSSGSARSSASATSSTTSSS